MQKTLKIGVVGVGGMGIVHISNYAHIEGCEVVAAVDRTEPGIEKAKEFGIQCFDSLAAMLDAIDIDVVDVCTPTFLHKTHVSEAIGARKHVICEKPIALSVEDANMMFDTAEKMGVGLYVGQVLQYSPATRVLRDLVRSGEYGKPLDAQFLRLSVCPRWVKNGWLFDRSKSGLLPFDLHIHDLDIIVHLFGAPKTVGYTSCGNAGLPYKEHYRFFYGYDDMSVVAEASWFHASIPFTATWRVYFENAVVINDSEGVIAYPFDGEPCIFNIEERITIPTGINVPPTGMYYEELANFLNDIHAGKVGCARREELATVLGILETIK